MSRFIVLLLLLSGVAFAQNQPLDPQKAQDAITVLSREVDANTNRARQAELAVLELQRQLEAAQKKAAACEPKKGEKK